jgi:hypothetical protein
MSIWSGSKVKLQSVTLDGHDLFNGFNEVMIYEDILAETWTGTISIMESVGLYETIFRFRRQVYHLCR